MRNEQGFTLVEIMLVVVIIGILASIVAVNVLPESETARINAAKGQISNFNTAINLFFMSKGRLPNSLQELVAADKIKKIPNDPWGNPYSYQPKGAKDWVIVSGGPDGSQGTGDDITSDDVG